MGENAFGACTSLTSITIPDSVISIGAATFVSCYSLTRVTFQGTITADNLGTDYDGTIWSPFNGDLRDKHLTGGPGTYTTTTPVPEVAETWNPVWTKQ